MPYKYMPTLGIVNCAGNRYGMGMIRHPALAHLSRLPLFFPQPCYDLPFIFAGQSGNVPSSELDDNFNAICAMAVTQCVAAGTNALTLTPTVNQTAVTAYTNYQQFGFVAAATSTSAVTANLNSLGSIKVFLPDGTTQAAYGSLKVGAYYVATYNSALDTGAGGLQLSSFGTTSQIPGTATNDTANAGNLGEIIQSNIASGSAVSLTSPNTANVTSIVLTAGDWDVYGQIPFLANGATVTTFNRAGLSTVSATYADQPSGSYTDWWGSKTGAAPTLSAGTINVQVANGASKTVYLIAQATFTTNTLAAYGGIYARRRR